MKGLFLPGEQVFEGDGYIRGHGTQARGDQIVSTYLGRLHVINKLVTVEPASPLRYSPEVGDVVIGRVVGIYNKKWRMELHSKSEVYLSLSAINLPGVVQRRKQESDEMSMREFFDINDLIVCEVQKVNKSGSAALHTRNEKYRKLCYGILVSVLHFLVEPLKTRFLSKNNLEVIVGCNGYVWVGSQKKDASSLAEVSSVVSRIREVAERREKVDVERLLEW